MTTKQEQDRRNFVHTLEVLIASAMAERDLVADASAGRFGPRRRIRASPLLSEACVARWALLAVLLVLALSLYGGFERSRRFTENGFERSRRFTEQRHLEAEAKRVAEQTKFWETARFEEGARLVLQRSPPLPKGYAESLTELLLPAAEWKAERLSFANESARAYQVTYGKGGIITIDRVMTKGNCRFSIKIESPASARIRHQIMIGTDMAEWEIIRRDPPSSEGQPFARTYFLRLPNSGRLRGLAFYEGTWAELDWGGLMPVPEGTQDSLLRLTWNIAQRLRQNYEQKIAWIARSLDDGSPAPTRPDLPDADARLEKPTRKPVLKQQVPD